VPWIDSARSRIDKVVADKYLVPSGNKVYVDIIGDVEIAVHAQEAGKGSVNGVMEGDAVKSIEWRGTEEEWVRCGKVRGSRESRWKLSGCTTATTKRTSISGEQNGESENVHIESTESVPTSDFARNEEVSLVESGGTGSGARGPLCKSVKSDLSRFIDTDGIEVESGDRHAAEVL
jgi:hypothetical protein